MYLAGGHAYVFFIYGMYYCLNVVTREPGNPQAVLIRAVQPLDADLQTNGPGKLCRAYRIDRGDDGVKLFSRRSRIWIEEGEKKKHPHIATTRVGIDYAGDAKHWPLRFYIEGNPYVSRKV